MRWVYRLVLVTWLAVVAFAPAISATLTVRFTNLGAPLLDPLHGKFYVYEPEERGRYVAWGPDGRTVRVRDGIYDVVVQFTDGSVSGSTVWSKIRLSGEVQRNADFQLPVAHLTIDVTSGGAPIAPLAGRVGLHRAGRRGAAVAVGRPGETLAVAPGLYDIEVNFRATDELKTVWLEAYRVEDDGRDVVEVGAPPARLQLTILHRGIALGRTSARWRVYRAGDHETPIAEAGSGESVDLRAGVYDVGLSYAGAGAGEMRWLRGVAVRGNESRRVEITSSSTQLHVDVHRGDTPLAGAWFGVYRPGDRQTPLVSADSGEAIELEPGRYDIGCFYHRGGLRAEGWMPDREVSGDEKLRCEIDLRAASLLVRAGRLGGRPRDANVMFLVDSSATTGLRIDGRNALDLLATALGETVREIEGSQTRLGLTAFGITPRTQRDCADSTILVPVDRPDAQRVADAVKLLRPSGHSPVAYALERAALELPRDDRNLLVLVVAGTDNCGGDPCRQATRLLRDGLVEQIFVIALDPDRETRETLSCIGQLYAVRTPEQLRAALREALRVARSSSGGSVSVFSPGWREWIAGGGVGQRLELSAGRYDVLIRGNGESFSWEGVEIIGDVEAPARSRPPQRR